MKAIILTKSAMEAHGASGVCTTAYDIVSDRIIRLVSNRDGGPITWPYNRRYECFDVIDATVVEACPIGPQQENFLINQPSITNIGHCNAGIDAIYSLYKKTVEHEPLYMNDNHRSMVSVASYHHSLEIVRVNNLKLEKNEWGKTIASFSVGESSLAVHYQYFSVKDPNYMLERNPSATTDIGTAFIIVSIPHSPYYTNDGEYKGYYKLIAAIYPVT